MDHRLASSRRHGLWWAIPAGLHAVAGVYMARVQLPVIGSGWCRWTSTRCLSI
ncbi:MAG: hypothetical protein U0792_04310 [Gemmataceae bacterium]